MTHACIQAYQPHECIVHLGWLTRSCNCGQKYTGETKRVLETHLQEHTAATQARDMRIISNHGACLPPNLWKETRILYRARHTTTLLIRGAHA